MSKALLGDLHRRRRIARQRVDDEDRRGVFVYVVAR